jgi:hypothetical protein
MLFELLSQATQVRKLLGMLDHLNKLEASMNQDQRATFGQFLHDGVPPLIDLLGFDLPEESIYKEQSNAALDAFMAGDISAVSFAGALGINKEFLASAKKVVAGEPKPSAVLCPECNSVVHLNDG